MHLKTVFVRFYKSFNFDYLRKHHSGAQQYPWEMLDGMWYPFVRVPIDDKVTTIVGANESGKTHLLTAIEKGISGIGIEREDFCRYSQFFTVELGHLRWPDFGFEWDDLNERDRTAVRKALALGEDVTFDRFLCFRRDKESLDVYLPKDGTLTKYPLAKDAAGKLAAALPSVFRIDSRIALPDSVPIRSLMEGSPSSTADRFDLLGRRERFSLFESLAPIQFDLIATPQSVTQAAAQLSPMLSAIFSPFRSSSQTGEASVQRQKSIQLARDLIRGVAKIDPEALGELYKALRDGREGHANGIIERINERLATRLNFPKWWVQDRDFALVVSPREYDLVFTIKDKTGTEYSFEERSQGLKYFLSYYVQYLSHPPSLERDEILVMDEPDAFLSSQAQQDLVRVLEQFSDPENGDPPVQVVYVTHSPFLIDKNHADRIRVLEKGVGDEGTRVVNDASKNHYEPLRSAFGAFVAETTFISTCNLFVEGTSDQVLIAGSSSYLRRHGISSLELLDLNQITIVPAGSASHIPYLAFLARGRDVERPAVIVLLDSDKSGRDAAKELLRDNLKRRQLLKPEFIFGVGELFKGDSPATRWSKGDDSTVEDLIPPSICAPAVAHYLDELGAPEDLAKSIAEADLSQKLEQGLTTWKAIEACVNEKSSGDFHIEKIGFARAVLDVVQRAPHDGDGISVFVQNMAKLFKKLGEMQRTAMRERITIGLSQRLDRSRTSFLRDHPDSAKREQALIALEEMRSVLDDSREGDATKAKIQELRRDFHLDTDVTKPIDDYPAFKEGLDQIKYTGRLISQDQ